MDPATIVGTAAAVADIVGIITKTIKVLRDLHNKWKDADLIIINLMAQLSSLKAALNKISEWISSDLAETPQHHQLILDLEDSISCCRILIKSMDGQISKLDWTTDGALDLSSKIKFVFENKASKDFQKFIKRQTSALTLLLTACNCKTSSEQKKILEKPTAREVFNQIKDDSSSLIVLHDTASSFTACTNSTGSSSKWSKIFPFDAELLKSPVYQRAVRAVFKPSRRRDRNIEADLIKSVGTLRHQQMEEYSRIRSEHIDDSIRENQKQMRNVIKVLLMGGTNSGKLTVLEHVRASHGCYSSEELKAYRREIFLVVVDAMNIVLRYANEIGLELESETSMEMLLPQSCNDTEPMSELASAIEILKTDSAFAQCFRACKDRKTIKPAFFLDHIDRITARGYSPTIADVLRIPSQRGIEEHWYNMGNLVVQVYNVWNAPSRFKWVPLDLTAIIFNVNLMSYDMACPSGNALHDVLTHFHEVVNNAFLQSKCIILLFHNVLLFRAKLTVRAFEEYFPAYDGDPGYASVESYISSRFHRLDRRCGLPPNFKRLYTIFDNCKPSVLGGVNSVLKSFILEQALHEFILV
ncbi:hypothetical protein MMC26_003120 [Xylographa opegraphella]|nr:hypothetical protein [Xylographa opegraphella]